MKTIFSDSEFDKLRVFSFIENAENEFVSVKDVESKFDMTYFIANKVINSLVSDLESMELDEFFFIEKVNNKYRFQKNGLDSINRLIWKYGRESFVFSLLDYSIQFPEKTIEDFSFDYYTSLSKAYKTRTELIEFFAQYSIDFFSHNYLEEEFRFLVAQLYAGIFKFYEYPFGADILDQVTDIIEFLKTKRIIIDINGFEKLNLEMYLGLSLLRIKEQVSTDKTTKKLFELKRENLIDIKNYMKEKSFSEEDIEMLFNFLYVNQFIDKDYNRLDINPELNKKMNFILEHFFAIPEIQVEKERLVDPIRSILLKHVVYKGLIMDQQIFNYLNVLEENYGEIIQVVNHFTKNVEIIKIIGNQTENKSLLLELTFCLINKISWSALRKVITISVDFSIGPEYNCYIMEMIENLPFANLNVNNIFNEETDIYVSDVLGDNLNTHYIIWNSPPTAKDWKVFGDLVTELKDKK